MAPGILLSADYEIYLGENFLDEREVLVEPTEALLRRCEQLGAPMTLFVDVVCLWRYREEGMDAFPDAVEEQLRDAVRRGHDVQAHIHPHWASAEHTGRRWSCDPHGFVLGRAFEGEGAVREGARDLLERARDYLEELLRPVAPDYRCIAYRAGNYGIQPHERAIIGALLDAGYLIDSSIVPGLVIDNEVNEVDFRGAATAANYYLDERSGIAGGAPAGIFEIPIPSHHRTPVDVARVLGGAVVRRIRPPAGAAPPRGTTIQLDVATDRGGRLGHLRARLARRLGEGVDLLELEPSAPDLIRSTRSYLRRVHGADDALFSLSTHPKQLDGRHLDALSEYMAWLRDAYPGVRALSFAEVAAGLPEAVAR